MFILTHNRNSKGPFSVDAACRRLSLCRGRRLDVLSSHFNDFSALSSLSCDHLLIIVY